MSLGFPLTASVLAWGTLIPHTGSSIRPVGPPGESTSQGSFDFFIGIHFFKKPAHRGLHLEALILNAFNGVVRDGRNKVPGPFRDMT